MSWSLPIFRIAGIQLRIHVTFLLLIAWLAFGYYAQGGSAVAASRVIFVLLLFLCVVLHEFGHAFAAKAFGINTPDITLLPIGGVARLERMPEEPVQELIIAVAGPLVNVVIALGLFVAGGSQALLNPSTVEGGGLVAQLLTINIMLVLFNLLPAFPMDGGRVLRALLHTTKLCTRYTDRRERRPGFCVRLRIHWVALESVPALHRAFRLYRCVSRSGPGADERCLAPIPGLQRDGARISHSLGRCQPAGSGGCFACDFATRFSSR